METSPAERSVRNRILDYFRIEKGELRPTLWLAFYLMLGMASVVCLKAVSDSVFLSVFDAKRLPYVDLAITVLVGAAVGLYLRLSNRLPLGRLIVISQLFLALNLFVFWLLLGRDVPGVPALVYVWVGIFAVLIPSQVWSLSGTLFDTRQAKRLFSIIGSGGILGAALGGNFAGMIGPAVGTEYILLATVGFVVVCAMIASHLTQSGGTAGAPSSGDPEGNRASLAESLRLVRGSRYLLLIALALFVSTIVSTLIKYQFKAMVQFDLGTDRDALTSFYGYFYGYVALFSFLFHTFLTGRLLRWMGLSACLLILPLALLGGTTVVLFSSSVIAAILARGSDQAFRHSIDRASVELLYIPIRRATRNRVKSFMDIVVGRSADGLASIVLLLLVSVIGVQTQQIGWASLLFIGFWFFVVWRLRAEYVATLRSTIERKDISAETLLRNLAVTESAKLDLRLQGSDQRTIEAAIDWMQYSGATAAQAHLASLLNHESATIRRKAMAVVAANRIPGCETEVLGFLQLEQDVESRWQALDYLEAQDTGRAAAAMAGLLDSGDRHLAATVAARMLHRPQHHGASAGEVFFAYLEWAAEADAFSRAVAARLIGLAPPSAPLSASLSRFLRDPDVAVVQAALLSAAAIRPWEEVDTILGKLPDRRLRREARAALAAFGAAILDTLSGAAGDPAAPRRIRLEIPRIMSSIGGQRAADLLVEQLRKPDSEFGYLALRALSRIRRRHAAVRFDRETIRALLVEKLRGYYQAAVWLDAMPVEGLQAGSRFLRRALRERLRLREDEIFRLLALVYPYREMLDAYHWIVSGRPDLRSNALEFLDSRLDNPIRQMLLPAIEQNGGPRISEAARDLFGLERLPYPNVLRRLLDLPDTWLQACASYVVAELNLTDLRPRLQNLAQHPNPLLRETAAAAQHRLATAAAPGDSSLQAT